MGLVRWLWRNTTVGRTVDTVKNMVDEGSVIEGIKRTAKEDWQEDNPITSKAYQSGRYDGKAEGYAEASDEYEKKLLEQADKFLQQKEIFESERDDYEQLLDEYDKEIDALNEKAGKTEAENKYLQQLLLKNRELRKLDN